MARCKEQLTLPLDKEGSFRGSCGCCCGLTRRGAIDEVGVNEALAGLGAPIPEPYDSSEECCFVIHALLIRSLTSRLISRSLQGLISDITRVHQV